MSWFKIVYGVVQALAYPHKDGGFIPVVEYQPSCREGEWWPLITWDNNVMGRDAAVKFAQDCIDTLRKEEAEKEESAQAAKAVA